MDQLGVPREIQELARYELMKIAARLPGAIAAAPDEATRAHLVECARASRGCCGRRTCARCNAAEASGRKQAVEEGAVALQRDAQVLGRDVGAGAPRPLEPVAFAPEAVRELVDEF